MKIEVIVTGNRSLYRSIYESIDRITTHRTATGAARSILKVERDAKDWERSCGRWGSYTLRINGRKLDCDDWSFLHGHVEDAISERRWSDPTRAIAKAIEGLIRDQSSE